MFFRFGKKKKNISKIKSKIVESARYLIYLRYYELLHELLFLFIEFPSIFSSSDIIHVRLSHEFSSPVWILTIVL